MWWIVSIPKPGSMPPSAAGLDGSAPSIEQAARALVVTARSYLRQQQREPSTRSVWGHIDGMTITIEGLLDPAIPERQVVEQIISVANVIPAPAISTPDSETRRRPQQSLTSCDLDTQLARIQNWTLTRLGRDVFIAGADPDPTTVEPGGSVNLPADLITLFGRSDGNLPSLMPGYDLLNRSRSDQIQALWLDIGADQRERIPEFAAAFDPAALSTERAGTACELFLPEFIPIADGDGTTLFVDTREGELSGCVSEYTAEGASDGWLWPSVADTFGALADSLEAESVFMTYYRPVVRDRTLFWNREPRS
ncbi:hypothetical protein ATK86_5518 [Nocardia fluminea]|uniref:Cell wall assembly regulator SMI1 n=2 Tax=Nocardia fluminea TaxID=134984 RepID=A0A2N3VHH7_9NOCA|nr:hypothetical protein ATK86_5518 [Nocardia fluminea]